MHRLDLSNEDDRLLGRCLRRQAEAIGDTDFLIAGNEHYSYERANAMVNRYARGFTDAGVARGNRSPS